WLPMELLLPTRSARGAAGSATTANNLMAFLPTPSARRATADSLSGHCRGYISTHALREEGDGHRLLSPSTSQRISTHALREEGDASSFLYWAKATIFLPTPSARRATLSGRPASSVAAIFLPTPSARRATELPTLSSTWIQISTHALREEGDLARQAAVSSRLYFYPRPPRGGRQELPTLSSTWIQISTHALREEGDGHAADSLSGH